MGARRTGGAHASCDSGGGVPIEMGQMILREQDTALDSIAGTLHTLVEQAGLMGREIGEHNE